MGSIICPKLHHLHLVDASQEALQIAKNNVGTLANCTFHHTSVEGLPFEDNSIDFAYSLGVLHHVPETAEAVRAVVKKLKLGAPFLVYLYYSFDNRPLWFRTLWMISDIMRRFICRLPFKLRLTLCQLIAGIIYFPLARIAGLLDSWMLMPSSWPLSYYRDKSFYVMRTDALDRFGTRLEKRFSKRQIKAMLESAGLKNIQFSHKLPYWCAVGFKGRI